jgi:peptidoglycan/xylan/chitin deacetylase (PgdA/CDA1 family)
MKLVTPLSQLYHLAFFLIKEENMHLETGMLIISIDVDVGDEKLGLLNRGSGISISRHHSERAIGRIEERALPLFVDVFDSADVPVTFAIRGQLMEVDGLIIDSLHDSSTKHDIGFHGYYHKPFTSLSRAAAEEELKKVRSAMKKFNLVPGSFIFPKNRIAYLDLLEKEGYKCYRGYGSVTKDRMHIERQGSLFNICPSLYINTDSSSRLLKRILDVSIARKLPFHIWFHLWNFGQERECILRSVNKIFVPLLDYAKRKQRSGLLTFETMVSAADEVRNHFETHTSGGKIGLDALDTWQNSNRD